MVEYVIVGLCVVCMGVLIVLDRKHRRAYRAVPCTIFDRIAVDHAIMVLHMYAQLSKGVPVRFRQKMTEAGLVVHYPKPVALLKNWLFHPIRGEIGFREWEHYFMYRQSMVGFIAINHTEKLISIAFRNTRLLADWVHNFDLTFRNHGGFAYEGPLHAGYTRLFDSFIKQLERLLDEVIKANEEDIVTYRLLITGHSLGGALATLTAAYLAGHKRYGGYFGYHNTKLVAFGAPYVGARSKEYDFTDWMSKHIGYIRCFERSTDMAPVVPKFLKVQTQKRLWYDEDDRNFIEPVPANERIVLFHYHSSRFNFRGGHSISKYREAIYKELKLPYSPIYKHFL